MGWLMGSDSESTSTLDFARYQDTDANWAVAEGLGSVVAHAGRDLKVQTSTEVTRVESVRGGFRVHTSRGVIACKAVVVTVSTALMLHGLRFDPALPVAFTEALHGIPLGVANKVFYRLKAGALPWAGMLHFTGTNRTSRTASYGVRPGGQELLVAFFGDSHARELEERGELDSFAREELAGIFGSDFPRQIEHAYATGWASDEFARGSYSSAMPGHARDREVLREPPREGLFYAGEATSLEHFGTIQGAWTSGLRAAGLVIRYLQTR
jgi:monoamine oxidase